MGATGDATDLEKKPASVGGLNPCGDMEETRICLNPSQTYLKFEGGAVAASGDSLRR
jgi:hypothetical protein